MYQSTVHLVPWPLHCYAQASTTRGLCTCRKKYRALIQALYDLPAHEVERLLPMKGGSLEVGVVTVPHSPVDGRVDVSVTVYFVNQEPLFFEYNRQWYPTGEHSGLPPLLPMPAPLVQHVLLVLLFVCCIVYCLWSNPGLLPIITTWPGVLAKLIGGAGECCDCHVTVM